MKKKLDLLANHLELIPQLAKWVWEEWEHLTPDRSLEDWIQRLAGRVHRVRIPLTLVAFEDDQPVGLASLVFYDMDTREDLSPWLAGVYVSPIYRKRGFGSELVSGIERRAASLGFETLYLYTNSAQRLYARLGWVEIDREPYRGREVVIMSKGLKQ